MKQLIFFCLFISVFNIYAQETVTIIASGETHAMLLPCDCNVSPGGGLAERATILDSLKKEKQILLLDAGGFCGGGIYDTYTEGRSIDSMRSEKTIRAMGLMNYDAVAIGDDDLAFGLDWLLGTAKRANLPLVCANIISKNKKNVVAPYIIVKRNSIRFGITSVTTPENLSLHDTSFTIANPLTTLKPIIDSLCKISDIPIIIAHTGEETTRALSQAFPKCKILVNGHRKTSPDPVNTLNNSAILQFGFQGKTLSFLTVDKQKKIQSLGILEINKGIIPNKAIKALLSDTSAVNPAKTVQYDLYIMSQCPYGLAALAEVMAFIKKTPLATLSLYFIGTQEEDSTLSSLHGEGEISDEMKWLALSALYPTFCEKFYTLRSNQKNSTSEIIASLALDTTRINSWIKMNGYNELRKQYIRSERLGISASPTLLINNVLTSFEMSSNRLFRDHCARVPTGTYCDSLPVCLDNSDCKRPGFLGTCDTTTKKSQCDYLPDTSFRATILYSTHATQNSHNSFIQTTQELFPAAIIDTIAIESPLGDSLLKRYTPSSLPFYLFENKVKRAHNFSLISQGVTDTLGALTFKPGVYPSSYFYSRPKISPRIDIFVDPLFMDAAKIIVTTLDHAKQKRYIYIKPMLFENPQMPASSPQLEAQRDEALRWLYCEKNFPKVYDRYLRGYAEKPGSSYWYTGLNKLGIKVDSFVKNMGDGKKLLTSAYAEISSLGLTAPVIALIDNCEVIPLRGLGDLSSILSH